MTSEACKRLVNASARAKAFTSWRVKVAFGLRWRGRESATTLGRRTCCCRNVAIGEILSASAEARIFRFSVFAEGSEIALLGNRGLRRCPSAGDSGWGRTGSRSLDDFSDAILINSHSGHHQYAF